MYLTSRLRAPGSGSALTVIIAAVSVLISTVILAAPVRADGLLPDSTNWDRTPLPRYAVVGAVTPTNASANAVDRAECRVPGERGRLFQRTRTTWYYPALGAWRAADCTVTPSQGGTIGLTFGPLLTPPDNSRLRFAFDTGGVPHSGAVRLSSTPDCSSPQALASQVGITGGENGRTSVPVTNADRGKYLCVLQYQLFNAIHKPQGTCIVLCISEGTDIYFVRGPWSRYLISTAGPTLPDISTAPQAGLVASPLPPTVIGTVQQGVAFAAAPTQGSPYQVRQPTVSVEGVQAGMEFRFVTSVSTCSVRQPVRAAQCTTSVVATSEPVPTAAGTPNRITLGGQTVSSPQAVAGRARTFAQAYSRLEGRIVVNGTGGPWRTVADRGSSVATIAAAAPAASASAAPAASASASATPAASASASPAASASASPAATFASIGTACVRLTGAGATSLSCGTVTVPTAPVLRASGSVVAVLGRYTVPGVPAASVGYVQHLRSCRSTQGNTCADVAVSTGTLAPTAGRDSFTFALASLPAASLVGTYLSVTTEVKDTRSGASLGTFTTTPNFIGPVS